MKNKKTCLLILILLLIPSYPILANEAFQSQAPNPPHISGPSHGKIDKTYNYSIFTTDPQGDDVYFQIDWGDCNIVKEWIGPFASGQTFECGHCWSGIDFPGGCNLTVKARAKDEHDHMSEWSEFRVVMSKIHGRSYFDITMTPILFMFIKLLNFLGKFVNNL
jgi:hypothetical protein